MWSFPLFPEQAGETAWQVDAVGFYEFAVAAFFTALIFVFIVVFAIRYHRGTRVGRANPPKYSKIMEVLWIGVPFLLETVMFIWATLMFYRMFDPPPDAMEVYVVGKQWMWQLQHSEGRAEINELHVPLGQPVKLHDDLAGRDPQLLHPRVPHQAGRPAGPVDIDVVPADQGRAVITCSAPSIAGRTTRT